jgi:Rrf2 family protein
MFGKRGEIVSAGDLVKGLKIPRPFLRKILQILHKEGILLAYKGKGGGFLLAKSAEKISLLGLMEIFQGKFQLNECLFKKIACPNIKKCALRKKVDKIERHVLKELRPVTIASLLR